jgi:hypothetical protein
VLAATQVMSALIFFGFVNLSFHYREATFTVNIFMVTYHGIGKVIHLERLSVTGREQLVMLVWNNKMTYSV